MGGGGPDGDVNPAINTDDLDDEPSQEPAACWLISSPLSSELGVL